MTTFVTVAVIVGYIASGVATFATLSVNFRVLRAARLVDHYDDTTTAAFFGAVLWPVIGLALLAKHGLSYGVTSRDRAGMRRESADRIASALAEHRAEQLRRMEREAGIR